MSLLPYYNKDVLEVGIDEAGRGPLFGRVYSAGGGRPAAFRHGGYVSK